MAKPATNKPETTQAGNKPAGNKPAGNKPAQNKPAVNKPVDNKPTDDKPVDQKPTEKKTTEKKSTDKKPIDKKPTEKKPADNKPTDNKPTEKKTTEKKQTPKAVEPKKQVANDATKKEDKPVANASKQQNQKRKREENGASAAHDVDKKLKPSTEAGVIPVHSGKRIVLFNLPEDATLAEVKALFPDPSKTPNVKFLSNANKERLGHANLFFTDDELYNQALAMTDLKIRDHEVSMRSEASIEKEKSVFASQFPRTIDENSIRNFFDGLEITFIYFLFSQTKITGSCIVEFADEAAKEAALAKSKTEFEGKKITVSSYETDRPKKEKAANPNAKKGKAPQAAKKGMEVTEEKSDKPQKQAPKPTQKPAAKKPVESKPSPAKNAKQNKTPAQKPNQTKPSPKKNNASPKPGAKTAAKPQKAAAKAQKKN